MLHVSARRSMLTLLHDWMTASDDFEARLVHEFL
jgi:hypothetical protein